MRLREKRRKKKKREKKQKKREKEKKREEKRKNRKDVNYPFCQKFNEMKRNFRKMSSRIGIK